MQNWSKIGVSLVSNWYITGVKSHCKAYIHSFDTSFTLGVLGTYGVGMEWVVDFGVTGYLTIRKTSFKPVFRILGYKNPGFCS